MTWYIYIYIITTAYFSREKKKKWKNLIQMKEKDNKMKTNDVEIILWL